MSTIEVNKITPVSGGTATTLGDSGDTFTVTSGATFNASSSNLANRSNANPLIINGDMALAQRGTSTSGITSSNQFVVDRWRFDEGADATLTMSQETLTSGGAFDDGFKKSLKLLVTTADGSLASNQSEQLMQIIEAQNLQLLKFGTSNAVNLTLAFWYKSNVTGTHVVTLDKEDSTRTTCPVEFTVSSADTWEHKVLNFNSDATIQGASGAIANDNGTGLRVMWNLAYGSDYTSGTNGDWTQNGVSDFSTSNQQNIVATNSNYVELTGVQLEIGQYTSSTLPPFQHESYADNLLRCQRYYTKVTRGVADTSICNGRWYNSSNTGGMFHLPTSMRSNPTLDIATGTNYYNASGSAANNYFDDFTFNDAAPLSLGWYKSGLSGTQGDGMIFMTGNANASVAFSSEL